MEKIHIIIVSYFAFKVRLPIGETISSNLASDSDAVGRCLGSAHIMNLARGVIFEAQGNSVEKMLVEAHPNTPANSIYPR